MENESLLQSNRKMKRTRGGQLGNQNARKHGFSSSTLSLTKTCEVCNLINMEGIKPEMAVLRIKLRSILQHDFGNHHVIGEVSKLLSKLYGAKYRLERKDTHRLKTFIKGILERQSASQACQPDKLLKNEY